MHETYKMKHKRNLLTLIANYNIIFKIILENYKKNYDIYDKVFINNTHL